MICCSIVVRDIESTIENINRIRDKIDLIEVRFDMFLPTQQELRYMYSMVFPKSFVFTVRNKKLLKSNIFKFLIKEACKLEGFLVDIDYRYISYFIRFGLPLNKIIVSYHNYKNIKGFREKFFELRRFGARYIKIAVTPHNLNDLVKLYKSCHGLRAITQSLSSGALEPILLFVAMGKLGIISRILYKRFASAWTYCCVDKGKETAPGQLNVDELLELYRIRNINDKTKLYGIIGNNIEHSLSSLYYNKNFSLLKMNCIYIPLDISTISGLKKFISIFGFSGFSVTSPYKDKLKHIINKYDAGIKSLKIANTLVIISKNPKSNKKNSIRNLCDVYGYNTDIYALKSIISEIIKKRRIQNILILGSGSMAKTAIYTLKKFFNMRDVYIYSRSKTGLQIAGFKVKSYKFGMLQVEKFDIVINCSKFGFDNKKNRFYEKALSLIKKNTVCIELNYKQLETPLISAAKRTGAKFYTGINFFQRQFEEQFKVFFDKGILWGKISEITTIF